VDGVEEWVEDEFMERASHALATESGTWLVDAVDSPRVGELQSVVGVLQLLDRHNRDCAEIAQRLGVPHVKLPRAPIPPFTFLGISKHEVALWWEEKRLLLCPEALGTARYFRAGNERLAVHPLLRWRPPRVDVRPDVVLCGHGAGIYEDADAALREALSTSRRRIPQQLASAFRAWRSRPRTR
jgi:hypothetical protein